MIRVFGLVLVIAVILLVLWQQVSTYRRKKKYGIVDAQRELNSVEEETMSMEELQSLRDRLDKAMKRREQLAKGKK